MKIYAKGDVFFAEKNNNYSNDGDAGRRGSRKPDAGRTAVRAGR